MAKFAIKNFVLLIGATVAGGYGMSKWDAHQLLARDRAIQAQLLTTAQAPKVDVHKLGLHGAWIDVHHDEDCGDHASKAEIAAIKAADEKARILFDTPGGAYTQADIVKNGLVPPSVRFKNVMFMYSMVGLPGQPIDPITGTRTCGAFDWTIGGQVYHFASVPSLEEFLARAKRDPKSIEPPSAYVFHGGSSRVATR